MLLNPHVRTALCDLQRLSQMGAKWMGRTGPVYLSQFLGVVVYYDRLLKALYELKHD